MLKRSTDIIIFIWLTLAFLIILMIIGGLVAIRFAGPEPAEELTARFFHLPFSLSIATGIILLQVAFSFASVLFLKIYFKKTISPEIFFFSAALLSICFEGFRFFPVLSVTGLLTMQTVVFFTRAVYFGRLLGIFMMFSAGLFSNGLVFQKQEMLFWVGVLIALFIAGSVPVDISSQGSYLLHAVNIDTSLALTLGLFYAIGILNFCLASLRNSTGDYFWLAGGLALTIAGREMLHLMPRPWAALVGFPLLLAGTVLFIQRTHKIYLWY